MIAPPCSAHACCQLPLENIRRLRSQLRGEVILPEDVSYKTARRIWNADIDRKPAMIVKCIGVNDVRLAVNYARSQKLRITVRGGGHNFCGYSIADGAMLIDLSHMRSVRVNVIKKNARVEGGCLLQDIDRETAPHGLACPLGCVSLTGVGGLTLGGGVGWLTPLFGLACHNVIAFDLVTADGEFRQVTAESDADLFYALRGGGNGNFGVVTSFKFRLHTLPRPTCKMFILFSFEKTKEVACTILEMIGKGQIPNHISPYFFMGEEPPRCIIGGAALCTRAEFDTVMAPLLRLEPLETHLAEAPWTEVQQLTDYNEYPGQMVYCKSAFIKNETLANPGPFMDEVLRHWEEVPNFKGLMIGIELFWRGTFEKLMEKNDCAFPHAGSRTSILFNSHIPTPGYRTEYIEWCRKGAIRLQEFCVKEAAYSNYAPPEEPKSVTFLSKLSRLQAVKQRLDPDGMFIGYLDKVSNPFNPK